MSNTEHKLRPVAYVEFDELYNLIQTGPSTETGFLDIRVVGKEQAKKNAEYVVKAVNSYQDMKEALEAIKFMSYEIEREGTYFGDTNMDNPPVVYGYNLALQQVKDIVFAALNKAQ